MAFFFGNKILIKNYQGLKNAQYASILSMEMANYPKKDVKHAARNSMVTAS